jgi:hypothetical protein
MLVLWVLDRQVEAQQTTMHWRHAGVMPPGAIGSRRLERGGPLPGYFQPVELRGPAGAKVAVAEGAGFGTALPTPLVLGMLIAPVYRLRVTEIPHHPGQEVFPTVEVIDRLYPPAGEETRFPIVVEIAPEELEMALEGLFVTRVIYLEDPQDALPHAQQAPAGWYEAAPGDDPLKLADQLGRPVAILRMGGRVP